MRRRIPFLQKEGRPYSKTYWNHENATKHINMRECGKKGGGIQALSSSADRSPISKTYFRNQDDRPVTTSKKSLRALCLGIGVSPAPT